MDERDSRLEAIDTPGPEDDPNLDINKITDLNQLAEIAQSNTTKVRKLQRLQVNLSETDNLHTELEPILTKRQRLGMRLIAQRDKIQKRQEQDRRKRLEESLRPTTGSLNNKKREIQDQAIRIYEQLQDLRKEHSGLDIHQRRLAARLKQWESTFLTMIAVIEKLDSLPSDLD